MIKPTMPRTGSYAPSAPRGSSSVHRRAMGTALLELGVEIAIGVAAFGMAFDGVVVVPYAVAAAALVDAVLIPVFYSCDFAVAYRRLMMGGSMLFFGAVLLLEMLPESAKEWLFGIDPTLPSAAGIAVVVAVAVYASYRLSVRIWSRREL